MKLVSRAEAKRLGLSRFYTGKTCRRKHTGERYVSSGACVACVMLNKSTPQYQHARSVRESAPEHRDKRRRQTAALYHRDSSARAKSAWNRVIRKYPDSIISGTSPENTFGTYEQARRLEESDGVPRDVDHITPLSAGGKHEPSNLQVITRKENQSKGGKCRRCHSLEERVRQLEARCAELEQEIKTADGALMLEIQDSMLPQLKKQHVQRVRTMGTSQFDCREAH